MSTRKSYDESCIRLQTDYLYSDIIPPIPNSMPKHDDPEPLGVSFFKTFVGEGDDLSNLTLPRTYFGKTEVNDANFTNTDFKESNLCWNNFLDVNFTNVILSNCDMRSSIYTNVDFTGADLSGSDLRLSSFDFCKFENAKMDGTTLTHSQGSEIELSEDQKAKINWVDDAGDEPQGG